MYFSPDRGYIQRHRRRLLHASLGQRAKGSLRRFQCLGCLDLISQLLFFDDPHSTSSNRRQATMAITAIRLMLTRSLDSILDAVDLSE